MNGGSGGWRRDTASSRDIEKKVLPIISKCLEGISSAGLKIQEKQVNVRCLQDCIPGCVCVVYAQKMCIV